MISCMALRRGGGGGIMTPEHTPTPPLLLPGHCNNCTKCICILRCVIVQLTYFALQINKCSKAICLGVHIVTKRAFIPFECSWCNYRRSTAHVPPMPVMPMSVMVYRCIYVTRHHLYNMQNQRTRHKVHLL